IVENWLQAGKQIDAIVCQNDGMAVGAGKAVQDAGVKGIIITGVDATSDGIDAIKSGMITGTVSQDAAGQGVMAVETLYKVVKGEELANNDLRTENIWIDASNVE
ncbi:MAG: substrate-binding domain-containing protein, partial [Christensenellales bacterium]